MPEKYVLITGASRGIGKSTALLFAANGYHVFLNCKSSPDALSLVRQEILSDSGSCDIIMGDVGNPLDVSSMFETIYHSCKYLDVLINNAGIAYTGLLSDMTDSEWEQIISTNLSSAFYCSRAAIPPMVARRQGRIINISSMWGVSGASCEAAYSAAKSGLNGLTRALAKELAPSNVQVNAIACGVIDTAMNSALSKEEREDLAYSIPAGRFGTQEEAASLIWTVAQCPDYMTGQIIGIDGGYL